MKSSGYNICVPNVETGETILFNTLYGSLSVWDPEEFKTVNSILSLPDDIPPYNPGIKDVLIDQKNLIEEDFDEMALIENRKLSGIKDENRLDVVIMPTLNCNFACKYCYEIHRPSTMPVEIEFAIIKWLESEVKKYSFVMLHWFGGEPLLHVEPMTSISKHLQSFARQSGTAYSLHMTTNGYLLNKAQIGTLIESGILDYQITLDGTADHHDQLRVLKNGKGTFERIYWNIIQLARFDKQVKITLRVNFNHTNFDSIPALLEMFPQDVRPHLRVMYEPIFGEGALSAVDNMAADQLSADMASYYGLAEELGYDVILGVGNVYSGKLVYCYAERENQYIVNYNGDIHKCSVSDFDSRKRIGFVRLDGSLVREEKQWQEWSDLPLFDENCHPCQYLPLCMGGCRKVRASKTGTGKQCSLVPTNASYILKQISLGSFENIIKRNC